MKEKSWPDWANYIAMDKNGDWWFFELEPNCEEEDWQDYNMGKQMFADDQHYELFRHTLIRRLQND